MTLRFAAAVLVMLALFTVLLRATKIQRDFNRALTLRLDPLPVRKSPNVFHNQHG